MVIVWSIFAVFFFAYGIIVLRANSGTNFFLVLLGCGVLCGLLSVAAAFGVWAKLPVGFQRICLILFFVGLLIFVVIEGFIISGFSKSGEKNLDYVIVLGAQVYESGPSVVLRYRLEEAVSYLKENPQTKCIVTGGQGSNEPFPEAVGMADYLKKNGIDEGRILMESESKTTVQNLSNSMKFIESGATVGLITNNFHMFRALLIARRAGLADVQGIAAPSTRLYLPSNMFREFFAMVKYLVF